MKTVFTNGSELPWFPNSFKHGSNVARMAVNATVNIDVAWPQTHRN